MSPSMAKRTPAPLSPCSPRRTLIEHEEPTLPEAQLDRFLFCAFVDYPSCEEEWRVLDMHHRGVDHTVWSPWRCSAVAPEEL